MLFGIYLLVSGVMQIMSAFAPGLRGTVRFHSMLAGALSFLLGLISCRSALESILLLALWIGFGWLITGINHADAAESSPYVPFRGWQIFGGIVLAIGAVVVIVWPLESLFALVVLSRVWLIVIGGLAGLEAFIIRAHGAELLGAAS